MIGVRDPIPGVIYPPRDRLERYVAAGELRLANIADELWESFARHAASVALSTAEGDVTYAELDDITDRLAGGLMRLGLRPLDRVLFQSANSKELTYCLIACFKAGIIPVCTLAAHREREIGYLGAHTEARALFVQADDPKFDLVAFAQGVRPSLPTVKHIFSMRGSARNGVTRIEDLIASEDVKAARVDLRTIERDPFQVAVFQLSGGTTGVPKVIPRMHNDYLLNARLTADILGYRSDDVMFMPMQIIHNACMICFWLPSLLTGSTFTIPTDLAPESWAERFRSRPPTFVGLIRPLLPRFEAAVTEVPAALESIRAFWSPDSSRAIRQKYRKPSYAMFGMSEGMNMYVRPGDCDEAADFTVGYPMSTFDEVRLVKPGTDALAEPGEMGELTCRGPYTLSGYYKAPERNSEAFTADGFYKTGDLLETREIGGRTYYAFAGRTKDVVDRGSEKVNCEEVENAVMTHTAVAACAVVGMPDPVLGERICAYVVSKPGACCPDVPVLQDHLRGLGLAKFKWPERVEPIEALPVTKVGKLDKSRLRNLITAKLERESLSSASEVPS